MELARVRRALPSRPHNRVEGELPLLSRIEGVEISLASDKEIGDAPIVSSRRFPEASRSKRISPRARTPPQEAGASWTAPSSAPHSQRGSPWCPRSLASEATTDLPKAQSVDHLHQTPSCRPIPGLPRPAAQNPTKRGRDRRLASDVYGRALSVLVQFACPRHVHTRSRVERDETQEPRRQRLARPATQDALTRCRLLLLRSCRANGSQFCCAASPMTSTRDPGPWPGLPHLPAARPTQGDQRSCQQQLVQQPIMIGHRTAPVRTGVRSYGMYPSHSEGV